VAIQSLKEDGRPATQWYWDDWFSSHDVQSCSWPAQGLWVNLLGIMFSSEIRGTLTINGRPVDNKIISKRFGHHIKEVNKLITELETAKVFSRLGDGTIYSRRMYRESMRQQEISQKRAEAGKLGMAKRWADEQQSDNKPITPPHNKRITKITASSSTSSSSPISTPNKKEESRDSIVGKNNKDAEILNPIEIIKLQWNGFAEKNNLAKVDAIKDTRLKHLNARMGEKDFNFASLLEVIQESPFLLGKKTDWRTSFDWVIKESNYIKIMEGNYIDRKYSGIKEWLKKEETKGEH